MPDPTAREALEDFRCWLVETCDHIRNTGEWLGTAHGPGDLMLFERSNGLRLAIDEIEQRIATLKDSKSAGAYDANGNPRTTPVRAKLPARHIDEAELVDDDPNPESETT